jgi:hypothetical protein
MDYKKVTAVLVSLGLFAGFYAIPGAFAASKSVSMRVSCTILPMVELSTASGAANAASTASTLPQRPELGLVSDGALVSIRSNLGGNLRLNETMRRTADGMVRLYSVTAL